MAQDPGVPVTGEIVQDNNLDRYSTHNDQLGRGGKRIVLNESAMLVITKEKRVDRIGMEVKFPDGSGGFKEYELINEPGTDATSISDWREIIAGTSSGNTTLVGDFTPTSSVEYPDTTGVDNGVWSIVLSSEYTYTAGTLIGKKINDGNGLLYNTDTGWSIISDYREMDMWKYYYIPKIVYISKDGDDSIGRVENSKYHFASFMGAYNAILDGLASGELDGDAWTIEYLAEDHDTVFIENDIYIKRTSFGISLLDIYVPTGVTLNCSSSVDGKSLFEEHPTLGYVQPFLTVKGDGVLTKTGTGNGDLFNIFFGSCIFIDSALELSNYTDGNISCLNIKNVDLVYSDISSISNLNRNHNMTNIKKIESEDFNFWSGNSVVNIINCDEVVSNTSYNCSGYRVFGKYKNSKLISNGLYNIAGHGDIYFPYIENCKMYNHNTSVSYNVYFSHSAYAYYIQILDSLFYVKQGGWNINTMNNATITDAEIKNSVFNIGIKGLATSSSAPRVLRRKWIDNAVDVVIGDTYNFYLGHYNESTVAESTGVHLTVVPTTIDVEDLIDLFIAALGVYQTTNPTSFAIHFTFTKGFDGTYWYFDVIGDSISYREGGYYANGMGELINYPEGFTRYLVSGESGFINLFDIDNDNKSITIAPMFKENPLAQSYF